MAIDATCPNCQRVYRLKDDLLGKTVTCATQTCRKVFPVVVSSNGPAVVTPTKSPPPAKPAAKTAAQIDAEALALQALADEPTESEDNQTIAIICMGCEHQWSVPWAMQGKNVLCPECRYRNKVPLQAKSKKGGWRESDVPQGAKREKLTDVVDNTESGYVGKDTLVKAGAVKILYDALPSSYYMLWVAVIAVPLTLLGGGVYYLMAKRGEGVVKQENANYQAVLDSEELKLLPLYRATLHIARGEYEARLNTTEGRAQAIKHFTASLTDLNAVPGKAPDRDLLTGELALALLNLGGEGEDLLEKRKLSWLPPPPSNKVKLKPDPAEAEGVQGQLQRVLQLLVKNQADFDTRSAVLRSLARQLIPRKQFEVLESNLSALFADAELYEAEAQLAIEYLRAGETDKATALGTKLKNALYSNPPTSPPAASAVALWQCLSPPIKGPTANIPSLSGGDGPIADSTRMAHTTSNILQKKPADARAVAIRAGKPDAQLRALALAVEYADDKPTELLDSASVAVAAFAKKPDPTQPPLPGWPLLRLAQAAAKAGATDRAEEFVKAIADEQLRAYAKAETLRYRMLGDVGMQPKDDDAELPADPTDVKKLKLGHVWGRLQLARATAHRTGDRGLSNKYAKDWPKTVIAPFGQAGAALGLQDAGQK